MIFIMPINHFIYIKAILFEVLVQHQIIMVKRYSNTNTGRAKRHQSLSMLSALQSLSYSRTSGSPPSVVTMVRKRSLSAIAISTVSMTPFC